MKFRLPAVLTGVMVGSTLSIVAGAGYIIDCRLSGGAVDTCWLTGLPVMGLGAGAGAGAAAGFNTYNPALRRPGRDEDANQVR